MNWRKFALLLATCAFVFAHGVGCQCGSGGTSWRGLDSGYESQS